MTRVRRIVVLTALCVGIAALSGAALAERAGRVADEAKRAGWDPARFHHADEDFFHDMDGGTALGLGPEEITGRNMWLVWSGGNDRFWDLMTNLTFGAFDLLKIVAHDPSKPIDRSRRWTWLGVMNEPCFDAPKQPDPERFGLLLDTRRADCPADPFENAAKYPGVRIGARGATVPVGSVYGWASGIVGLRLFPNPAFDEAAKRKWDARRYFTDESYYKDKDLIRPYRVGMSCGFCHAGPSPIHPPADPANPKWENLSSTVGAQYLWVDRLFVYDTRQDNFMFQLVHTYRPGAMDTSLVSTDNINNPRTMNAIYSLGDRLGPALRWGRETLAGGERDNKQFNDYVAEGPLTQFFRRPNIVWTPHVLKDGSDSVGVLGALNRVYLNIGLFSEEWLLHFNAIAGGKPISPIPIATAERNSAYWRATEAGTPDMALFFLKAGRPDHLADAPGGAKYLTADAPVLDRGKTVFAETCARCHSSKAPTPAVGLDPAGCAGPGYAVLEPILGLDGNRRLQAADERDRPCARLPGAQLPVGRFPRAGDAVANQRLQPARDQCARRQHLGQFLLAFLQEFALGRDRHRPRSLHRRAASLRDAGRRARLHAAAIADQHLVDGAVPAQQRARPVRAGSLGRGADAGVPGLDRAAPVAGEAGAGQGAGRQGSGSDRPHHGAELHPDRAGFVPELLRPVSGPLHVLLPKLFDADGGITIGPIPAGTPVNLLANVQPLPEEGGPVRQAEHVAEVFKLLLQLKLDLLALPKDATDAQVRAAFANAVPSLLKLNKCPDFVVNRGHYFGTGLVANEPALSDDDKRALIEFLKTF